jgi:hypothetical protein
MHVLPRFVDVELLQSKLNLDFIKFTNDLFCVTSVLKLPHNKIGVLVSGFMLGNIGLTQLTYQCEQVFLAVHPVLHGIRD